MNDIYKGFLLEHINNVTEEVHKRSNDTDLLLSQMLVNQEYQSCLMELQNGI